MCVCVVNSKQTNKQTNNMNCNHTENEERIIAYLEHVASNPLERRAMEIAKDHLGSSFDIARSNGYRSWVQKQK